MPSPIFVPSPNFGERKGFAQPKILVFHYTAMDSCAAALKRLSDPNSQVSSHYLVDDDGTVFQLVDESKRAWHAGKSFWGGVSDVNSASIGIEISNLGTVPFPDAQINSVLSLAQEIVGRYHIQPGCVVGHSDIAPLRKIDPGTWFPWSYLAEHGVGLWAAQEDLDCVPLQGPMIQCEMQGDMEEALAQLGYNPEDIAIRWQSVLEAFHRHFMPEALRVPVGLEVSLRHLRALLGLQKEQ